jgi:hypothetical protein
VTTPAALMVDTAPPTKLTRMQFFVLNWFVAIVLVGVVVPTGFAAIFLAAGNGSAMDAFDHGELFLAAGNCVVASSAIFISSGVADGVSTAIASLCALLVVAAPSYALWAYISTQATLRNPYNSNFASSGGWIAAIIALIVSTEFVMVSAPDRRLEFDSKGA